MYNSYMEMTKWYSNHWPRSISIDPGTTTIKVVPLSRDDFCARYGLATLLCISRIALSIFCLTGVGVTCGLNNYLKISLRTNINKSLMYAKAIPFGIKGFFYPEKMNKLLPAPDLYEEVKNVYINNLSQIAKIETLEQSPKQHKIKFI